MLAKRFAASCHFFSPRVCVEGESVAEQSEAMQADKHREGGFEGVHGVNHSVLGQQKGVKYKKSNNNLSSANDNG